MHSYGGSFSRYQIQLLNHKITLTMPLSNCTGPTTPTRSFGRLDIYVLSSSMDKVQQKKHALPCVQMYMCIYVHRERDVCKSMNPKDLATNRRRHKVAQGRRAPWSKSILAHSTWPSTAGGQRSPLGKSIRRPPWRGEARAC